jgi:hypothetical protein
MDGQVRVNNNITFNLQETNISDQITNSDQDNILKLFIKMGTNLSKYTS